MIYSFPKILYDNALQLFWWINNVRAIQLNGGITTSARHPGSWAIRGGLDGHSAVTDIPSNSM